MKLSIEINIYLFYFSNRMALRNVARVGKHVPGISFPKRTPFVPVIPDWPVIPENILKIAALAEQKGKL